MIPLLAGLAGYLIATPSKKTKGLKGANSRVCKNRVKCKGIDKNGKLRKGHKFNRKGEVIKVKL